MSTGVSFPAVSAYREAAEVYIQGSHAGNTVRAYEADWRDFAAFCSQEGYESLPASAETVALYLTWLVDVCQKKPSTLSRRLAAIGHVHRAGNRPSPTGEFAVRAVMAGIRRKHGRRPDAKKPLSVEVLKQLLEQVPATPVGRRNRALLLIGFSGGFRRSELVAIRCEDLEWRPEGVLVTIGQSKGDPEGEGQVVGIPRARNTMFCPVEALREWIESAGIECGPVFLSTEPWTGRVLNRGLEAKRVATLIQQLAARAGLNAREFGGHSLRSGLATTAAAAGAPERAIMNQTRHQSVGQMRRYIRRGTAFMDNAASYLDL